MACMFYIESILNKGYETFKEHLIIEGIPVRFIVAYNELIEGAIENVVEKYINNVKTKVVSPEYLIAIMLQTYRKKDKRYGLIEKLRSVENYE